MRSTVDSSVTAGVYVNEFPEPVETAQGRIDLIMDVDAGKVEASANPAKEFFYKAYNINYWAFTAFVGFNLFQFGFTNFCPMALILKKLGVPESAAACSR